MCVDNGNENTGSPDGEWPGEWGMGNGVVEEQGEWATGRSVKDPRQVQQESRVNVACNLKSKWQPATKPFKAVTSPGNTLRRVWKIWQAGEGIIQLPEQ